MWANLAEFYRAGGLWMHPISLLFLVALGLCVKQLQRPNLRLMSLLWGCLGLILMWGGVGFLVGAIEGGTALLAAPPEIRPQLLEAAFAIAFNSSALALFCVTILAHLAVPLAWSQQQRDLRTKT